MSEGVQQHNFNVGPRGDNDTEHVVTLLKEVHLLGALDLICIVVFVLVVDIDIDIDGEVSVFSRPFKALCVVIL